MIFQLLYMAVAIDLVQSRELILGQVLWRHADRNSGYTYPRDPFKEDWKDLQFTDNGMALEYDLGRFLKTKYGILLSKSYREGEIYLRSIDIDRSLVSAQCVAAGLYSSENATKWAGSNTPWQPVPIHTKDKSSDWLYQIYQDPKSGCEPYDMILEKIAEKSKWHKKYSGKYDTFFKGLREDTGVEKPYGIKNISGLYDNLQSLKLAEKELPEWAERDMDMLGLLSGRGLGFEFTGHESSSKFLAKMRSGVIMENILQNMEERINSVTTYSLIGYALNDRSLVALLASMGVYDWIVPPYASHVIIDLYKDEQGTYSVELWYSSGVSRAPSRFSFYDCDKICDWAKFKTTASSVATGKMTPKLCGIRHPKDCCKFLLPGILVLMSVTLFFFPLYFCLRCMNRRKNEPIKYNILDLDEIESMRQEKSL